MLPQLCNLHFFLFLGGKGEKEKVVKEGPNHSRCSATLILQNTAMKCARTEDRRKEKNLKKKKKKKREITKKNPVLKGTREKEYTLLFLSDEIDC